ncbi:MAG: heme exporter protein CcmB [Candidatus Kapabacteria bacterium]|nr:heme exporter protein CcmB [Ignavibacteriota bacterium]MCW5883526.1 heme exporter protein CcmB [Candidatus Kapabacteria bacterium]
MAVLAKSIAVLKKELLSEFRTRYAISAILLFVLTTITMIVFATSGDVLSSEVAAGVLWIVMFFGAMTGLSKSFVSEEERGTSLYLKLVAGSSAIYFGKLIFNIILSISLNVVAVFLFFLFIGNIEITNAWIFILSILMGSLAIASATTIISALIAKANSKNALFPVLSFPIILPVIILGIQTTVQSFTGADFSEARKDFQLLFSYSGLMILASYFLFDFVWKE